MIDIFKPSTMKEELDFFSAKMIHSAKELNTIEANALKYVAKWKPKIIHQLNDNFLYLSRLSLSHVVNIMNADVLQVYKKYIKSNSFWDQVDQITVVKSAGVPSNFKNLYTDIITVILISYFTILLMIINLYMSY